MHENRANDQGVYVMPNVPQRYPFIGLIDCRNERRGIRQYNLLPHRQQDMSILTIIIRVEGPLAHHSPIIIEVMSICACTWTCFTDV